MSKFGEELYNLLPPVYKREDSQVRPVPFPLKRFLDIAGTGFDYLEEKQKGHENLYDLDHTPKELLPHLAQMMGFDFPYDMTEHEQRSFLKVLPMLYKFKGTSRVFDYLGQVIFGAKTRVESSYRLNTDPDLAYKHVIDVYVQVTGSTMDTSSRADRYTKFADKFRPINTVLNPVIQMFYTDIYDKLTNGDTGFDRVLMTHFESDVFDTAGIRENEAIIALRNMFADSYNKDSLADTFNSEFIKDSAGTENIGKEYVYANDDYAHYVGAKLNTSFLNDSFVLNSKPRTIKL